jgi:hypothetical protein
MPPGCHFIAGTEHMKTRDFLLVVLLVASPVTGAIAQCGEAPDITIKQSKEWNRDDVSNPSRTAATPSTKAPANKGAASGDPKNTNSAAPGDLTEIEAQIIAMKHRTD